jgi:hypothetical protein
VSPLRRLAPPLAGIAVGLALIPGTWTLDRVARGGQLGPGFWPRLVLAGFVLACAARAVAAWREGRRAGAGPGGDVAPPVSPARLALGVALVLGYVAAAPLLGFPAATAAFLAAFMPLAGARRPGGVALAAAAGTIGLCYLFVKVVYLPLPKGAGPFEAATIALYRALGIF